MSDKSAVTMYRGDSYPIVFTINDKTTRLPIDLTGGSVKLTVSSVENPPDATTKIFDIAGALASDPKTGVVTFSPTVGNTSIAGSYFYDVQLTGADGSIRTVAKSTFVVLQDITK